MVLVNNVFSQLSQCACVCHVWTVEAGEYLKQLSSCVAESKLKTYVDAEVVDAVRAATGEAELHLPCPGDSTSLSSTDADEIPEDESFLNRLCTPSDY